MALETEWRLDNFQQPIEIPKRAPTTAVDAMSQRPASHNKASKVKVTTSGPSKVAGPSNPPSRSTKRAAETTADEDDLDELGLNGDALDLLDGDDSADGEEDSDGEAEIVEEDEELFPELDSGSELDDEDEDPDEVLDGTRQLLGDEDGESDGSDLEDIQDEEDGSQSGYNSSDIEAQYSSSTSLSSKAPSGRRKLSGKPNGASTDKLDKLGARTDLSTDEKLARMIAADTVKPDESVGDNTKISRAKEGKGVLRPSRLVPGGYRREYDDIEAGYGSESSTEDVGGHWNVTPLFASRFRVWRAKGRCCRTPIPLEIFPWNGTTTCHISGTTVSGRKIFRPAQGDELDKFLSNVEDPSAWTSVQDKSMQQNVQLTDKELDIIRRLERAENPDADFDPYQSTIEWFTGKGQEMVMPLSAAPEPKRRFVPSKWEHQKVCNLCLIAVKYANEPLR